MLNPWQERLPVKGAIEYAGTTWSDMRAQTTTGVLPGALSLVQGEERTTQRARGGDYGGCCKAGEARRAGLGDINLNIANWRWERPQNWRWERPQELIKPIKLINLSNRCWENRSRKIWNVNKSSATPSYQDEVTRISIEYSGTVVNRSDRKVLLK